jgi:hypothetical protein
MRARISGPPPTIGGGSGGASVGDGAEAAPMLYVFDICRDFIRSVPVLHHDSARPEDLDTAAEDHIAGETRYACLSRPLIARHPDPVINPPDRWEQEWGRGTSWKQVGSWKVL